MWLVFWYVCLVGRQTKAVIFLQLYPITSFSVFSWQKHRRITNISPTTTKLAKKLNENKYFVTLCVLATLIFYCLSVPLASIV